MKVAVIGGAGFIGTRLCNRLFKKEGVDFVILDKVVSSVYPEKCQNCNVEQVDQLRSSLSGEVDVVINLAAEHRDNVYPASRYYDVNVQGQKNICKVMKEFGIQRHIFTSSVAIYGFVSAETFEDGKFAPFHDYGKSKLEAEGVLDSWFSEGQKQNSVIRPTVVFGEGNRGNVYNLLRQISTGRFLMIGSGKNRKSMAYVENLAAFLEYLIDNGGDHQVFNFVDKPDFDMNELCSAVNIALGKEPKFFRLPYGVGLAAGYAFDILAKVTGKEFPISSIRIKKFCGTTLFGSKSISATNFAVPVPLAEGLKKTVESEFK